jgi:glycosyltransferase involved in cell wall biosynthesis
MHLALVIDPDRLVQDGAALQRLAVALVAEGVRVRRVLPTARDDAPLARLIPVSTYDFAGSPLFRASRLGALSSELEEDKPDAFVSFGPRAFEAAAELARDLDAGLVAMVSTATPLRRHADRLDLVGTSTGPVALRAARVVGDDLTTVLPLGVATPDGGRTPPPPAEGIAIAGPARDDGAYRAVFSAIASLMPTMPDLQVAIELPPGHDPKLWTLARELRVQRVLNGVTSLESIRPLALACGVVALPEAVGGTRSIVLEAMAIGRCVVALEDPMADHLIDGVTALVAAERDARVWGTLLSAGLRGTEVSARIGAEASVRTAARFGSARCAAQLAQACETVVRGPAIPFPGPADA